MSRRLLLILAVAFLVISTVSFYSLLTLRSYLDPFDDQPFDSTSWKNNVGRTAQAQAARAQIQTGQTKAEVRNLLGEGQPVTKLPGNVDRFGNRLRHAETWGYYFHGFRGSFLHSYDDAFLYVHFDRNEQVVAAQITGG